MLPSLTAPDSDDEREEAKEEARRAAKWRHDRQMERERERGGIVPPGVEDDEEEEVVVVESSSGSSSHDRSAYHSKWDEEDPTLGTKVKMFGQSAKNNMGSLKKAARKRNDDLQNKIQEKRGKSRHESAGTYWSEERLLREKKQAGFDVSGKDENGRTALYHALTYNNLEQMALLLRVGADPNVVMGGGTTLLHIAAKKANGAAVSMLLETGGADHSLVTKDGSTALHVAAAQAEGGECVRLLLQFGGDKDALRYNDGSSAVHIAVRHDSASCLQHLLEAGLHTELQDGNGDSLLIVAARNNAVACAEVLLWMECDLCFECGRDKRTPNEPPDVARTGGETALHICSRMGHVELLRMLLEAGAEADKMMEPGVTPVLLAVESDNKNCLECLLSFGAHADTVKDDGSLSSALHVAVEKGDAELIRLLCSSGAKVNWGNARGMTPLFCASQRNDDLEEICCEALIAAGATQMRVPPGHTRWATTTNFASFVV